MTQSFSVAAVPTTGAPDRKPRGSPGCSLVVVSRGGIIAVGALVCDASLTPDQRIQAYVQSGMFP